MTIAMLLVKRKSWRQQMNAPPLWSILMAMTMRWCNAERIAQYIRSMATLDAIGCCHWASICPVLPWRMPWSSI